MATKAQEVCWENFMDSVKKNLVRKVYGFSLVLFNDGLMEPLNYQPTG
jgi:hypothetical protein